MGGIYAINNYVSWILSKAIDLDIDLLWIKPRLLTSIILQKLMAVIFEFWDKFVIHEDYKCQ